MLSWWDRAGGATVSDRRKRSTPILSERREFAAERRIAPRYATSGTAAVISWPVGTDYRTTGARMIDISLGGFSAIVETFPPCWTTLWIRLDGKNPSDWLRAVVIGTVQNGCLFWTRRRVRGRFLEACPYDLFKGAIDGFSQEIRYTDPASQGINRRCWR
jgi:hypothetical protein